MFMPLAPQKKALNRKKSWLLKGLRGNFPVGKLSLVAPESYIRHTLLITRYLLFMLTSIFYLISPPYAHLMVKISVVLSFFVATILAQSLYAGWDLTALYQHSIRKGIAPDYKPSSKENIPPLGLIIIETICVAFLIMPTGGLDSHFVWYALNPIIAAAVYLPGIFCWGTLGLFLITAFAASHAYFGAAAFSLYFFVSHMNLLLVFFVSTSLAQVAISLCKRLGIAYTLLATAHQATERSLKHISSLYQALEAFSTRENSYQLGEVLAHYTRKLCEAPAVCYLKRGIEQANGDSAAAIIRVAQGGEMDKAIAWEKEMYQVWGRIKPTDSIIVQTLEQGFGEIVAVPILSKGECFGLLAYQQEPGKIKHYGEKKQTLIFLAGVAGIILERLKTDKLWERLLVSEEQNRIANEIHDGVSQYLFSMVCALDALCRHPTKALDKKTQAQLKLVEQTANLAARELRASIYKLSPHQRGESIFVDNLASYLDDLGRLNGIQVDLQAEGSEEVLSSALRKALYRIVREASSNAIRHGKCSSLKVDLCMLPNRTILEVKDNGCGCNRELADTSNGRKNGLGYWNMYQLAHCFNGELEILSEAGKGTVVRFKIPKGIAKEEGIKEVVIK